MIDININAILSQALAAAVQQALQPIQQEYANKMAEMAQRIAALEAQSANRHERLRVLEGALTDRVAALENNPAQGVDTTLEQRIAALEKHTAVLDQHGDIVEYLDNQEWFWAKIRRFADGVVESAVEQHCEEYDHSDMVMKHELPDMDDYIKREDLDSEMRDAVRDILEDARIHLRF